MRNRFLSALAALVLLPSVALAQDPGLAIGQPAIKEQVRAAIQEMLERPAFHTVTGVPVATLGFDNDTAIDITVGTLYRKQAGEWVRLGEVWFDNTTTP